MYLRILIDRLKLSNLHFKILFTESLATDLYPVRTDLKQVVCPKKLNVY